MTKKLRIETKNVSADGTSLQGYVTTTRRKIEAVLGKPNMEASGDGKVSTEWAVEIGGVVATIYDWKEARAPKMDETYHWHIGGKGEGAVVMVEKALGVPARTDY